MTDMRRSTLPGCCSPLRSRPASLARTRGWHSTADRFLTRSRPVIIPASIMLGALASLAANQLSGRDTLVPGDSRDKAAGIDA